MRTMYDSTQARDIPLAAEMVAGYLPPSRYAWSAADWARFPRAVKIRIAIFASVNDGHVLDVEPGDATPAEAPGWVLMRRASGVDPTVYCNQSTWPEVRAAFRAQRVPEPHYWIARYDGVRSIPAGAVAKQYANPPVHRAGHFDLSAVADHWPGVDTKEANDMGKLDSFDPKVARQLGRIIAAEWSNYPMTPEADADQRVGRRVIQLSRGETVRNGRKLDALIALVTELATDPDITADRFDAAVEAAVSKAVAEHMPTAGEVAEAQRAFLEELVREVVPDEQADLIIEKLAEKLGAKEEN